MTTAFASKTSGGFNNLSQGASRSQNGTPPNRPNARREGALRENSNRETAHPPQSQPQRQEASSRRFNGSLRGKPSPSSGSSSGDKQSKPPVDHPILFQKFFKSVGPRTYVAQVKKAGNGNHYVVLTEANRKKDTDELRKTRLFLFSEDFAAFFDLLRDTQNFIDSNPVDPDVAKKQSNYWKKKSHGGKK